jgi:xylan 1,4-beta-xylosidase
MKTTILLVLALTSVAVIAQPVGIRVSAAHTLGEFKPIYGYFGYDEANYTYMKNGPKLLNELAQLASAPVYIRTHFMLATGDGSPSFKWGSTNAYTEDASGKPVYDWTIVDRIIDTYLEAKTKPFVEIGFMPEALSKKPEPYKPVWSPGAAFDKYYVGWSFPPKDYAKWGELVYQWVHHEVEKHGGDEVASWYWEVWNEPDISYWHGSPEEYDKLYDYAAAAVKRALPRAKVGGPASTGPASPRAAAFLRQFLEHCAQGRNDVTGAIGSPLDFITYHAKGRPSVVEGHVRMGISKNLDDVEKGFEIIGSFAKFRDLPIVLSESDPEGCAGCSARVYPQNAYRNGPLYPSYTAAVFNKILKLADKHKTNIEGMLTWAFEFEDQPYFDGFRTLATNGIDKPVLNLFRMDGLMRGDRVAVQSSAEVSVEAMIKNGVQEKSDIDAIASRSDHAVSVLLWNYHDDDVPAADAPARVTITGLPASAHRVLLSHYRIDHDHSNAYTVWKQMGSPQNPGPEQYARLESAGQLQLLESPRWLWSESGQVEVSFALPRQAVSLVRVSW